MFFLVNNATEGPFFDAIPRFLVLEYLLLLTRRQSRIILRVPELIFEPLKAKVRHRYRTRVGTGCGGSSYTGESVGDRIELHWAHLPISSSLSESSRLRAGFGQDESILLDMTLSSGRIDAESSKSDVVESRNSTSFGNSPRVLSVLSEGSASSSGSLDMNKSNGLSSSLALKGDDVRATVTKVTALSDSAKRMVDVAYSRQEE